MFAQTGGTAYLPPATASVRAPSPPGLPAVMNANGSGAFSVLPNGQVLRLKPLAGGKPNQEEA